MLGLLRRNRDIRLLFLSQVISLLGDWFAFIAIAGMVQDQTESRFLVSLVFVSMTLPTFLASPFAGVVADRFNRRKIIIWVSIAQSIAALGVLIAQAGHTWVVFLSEALVAGLAAFVTPASEAAVPNLVDNEDDLRRANSLLGSLWGIMLAVGAGLGGVFSEMFGRTACFLVDAGSFAVAALLIAMVKRPMQETLVTKYERAPMRPVADMREAINVARNDNVVMALVASKMTFAVGAGLVGQIPVFAATAFNAGDSGRGVMMAVRGVGSALGPILGARVVRNNLGRILTVCGFAGLLFSLSYFAASVSQHLLVAAAFIGIAHIGGGAQWTLSTYGLQLEVPDKILGRVIAGDRALVTLTLALTSLIAGVVSEAFGVRIALASLAGAAACAGTTYLWLTRSLRATLGTRQPQQ